MKSHKHAIDNSEGIMRAVVHKGWQVKEVNSSCHIKKYIIISIYSYKCLHYNNLITKYNKLKPIKYVKYRIN